MLCLRRTAFRNVRILCTSIAAKPRFLTTSTPSIPRTVRSTVSTLLQRRFTNEHLTQNEPEADGASEAQAGKNSIAASSDGASRADDSVQAEELATSANKPDQSTVAEAMASAADTISTKASQAAQSAVEYTKSAQDTIADAANTAASAVSTKPPVSIYVGNLFFDVSEDDLRKVMSQFGEVTTAKLIYDPRGLSKGFGYVDFADPESARKAVDEMNGQIFEGRPLTVQFTLPRRTSPFQSGRIMNKGEPSNTLFIGNMSFEMADKDLYDMFAEIKNVVDIRVAIDRKSGQPRGFAHAEFIDTPSAEKAMSLLEGKESFGRRLRVDFSMSSANWRKNRENNE